MIKLNKKKLFLLIIAFIIFYCKIEIVRAVGPIGSGYTGGPSPGGSAGTGNTDEDAEPTCGLFTGCGIEAEWPYGEEITLSESVYDTDGKYLGEAYLLQDKMRFLSGRFIGLDAFEEYKRTWYATIDPFCYDFRTDCDCVEWGTCIYAITYGGKYYEIPYSCVIRSWTESNVYSCGGNCKKTSPCHDLGCSPPSVASCRPEADRLLALKVGYLNDNPLYDGKRQDVNDIKKGVDAEGEPTLAIDEKVPYYGTYDTGKSEPDNMNAGLVWRTETIKYSFNVQKACVHPVTSKVIYVRAVDKKGNPAEEPCPEPYIAMPEIKSVKNDYSIFEGQHVGQYYIPLNAKSTDVIKYNLLPNIGKASKLSSGLCTEFIKKYNKDSEEGEIWRIFLTDANNVAFNKATSEAMALRRVRKGCYLVYNASFKIKKDGGLHGDKGYNIYYRPIDVGNPFPNGLDKKSFWNGLYDANSNTVSVTDANGKTTRTDLDNSYDAVTYYIDNMDLDKIRNYNLRNLYTDWSKINLDGSSQFINGTEGNFGIVRNNNNCHTFYALGCGPANANWQECQQRQKEICKK